LLQFPRHVAGLEPAIHLMTPPKASNYT